MLEKKCTVENYSNIHPFETYKSLINDEARTTVDDKLDDYVSRDSNYLYKHWLNYFIKLLWVKLRDGSSNGNCMRNDNVSPLSKNKKE
ncbi:hypothetical protein POWCR01_000229300 [Plasmodium ovale]|uniref:Uncharacterized protein n=1 Tax=Plasmodium ovale TaxID=36330 RepID=A0A1C3KKQ5_PLAOA|nr:hypothetical protein POWCR01_000229300 [Plasmodium ovale]